MSKEMNRGDWEAMINTMDKIKAGAQKSMTPEDKAAVDEKIAEIRAILDTYIPRGLN